MRAGVGVGKFSPTPTPTSTPAKFDDSDRLRLMQIMDNIFKGEQLTYLAVDGVLSPMDK